MFMDFNVKVNIVEMYNSRGTEIANIDSIGNGTFGNMVDKFERNYK